MKRKISLLLLILQSTLHAQQLKISEPLRFLALGDSYTAGTSVDINRNVAQRNNIAYFDITPITQLGLDNPELLLYPNPASDYLIVRFNSEDIAEINSVSIYSFSGILLLRNHEFQNSSSSEINLLLPDLTNGIYLIEVLTPTRNYTSKFIIRRDDN